ncbi:MAG: hypothetical protein GXO69_02105, partial [Acidobacteria bacterium]|nr:hypothetical protein [Acidobacteriota bacterium]
TMEDTKQFHSIPGDTTRLYHNPDGFFNVGFILGHTAQVALDFFGAGKFKTRTPIVEVENVSELSLRPSAYVNTDAPVLNDLLTDERGFVRIEGEFASKSESNIVYRALNSKDAIRFEARLGLEAKNLAEKWNVGEHVALGSRVQ